MTLEREIEQYAAKTTRSRQLFEEALRAMPGGNSRTTTFFDPYPFYITRGEGPRIWDADGIERLWEISTPLIDNGRRVHRYTPGSWGPDAMHDLIAPRRWHLPDAA